MPRSARSHASVAPGRAGADDDDRRRLGIPRRGGGEHGDELAESGEAERRRRTRGPRSAHRPRPRLAVVACVADDPGLVRRDAELRAREKHHVGRRLRVCHVGSADEHVRRGPPARSTSARAIRAGVFVMTAVARPRARSAAKISGTSGATARCDRWSAKRSA